MCAVSWTAMTSSPPMWAARFAILSSEFFLSNLYHPSIIDMISNAKDKENISRANSVGKPYWQAELDQSCEQVFPRRQFFK